MRKYLQMSSAAIMIGALRVNSYELILTEKGEEN